MSHPMPDALDLDSIRALCARVDTHPAQPQWLEVRPLVTATRQLCDAVERLRGERDRIYAEVCAHCRNGLPLRGEAATFFCHEDGLPVTETHCGLVGCGADHLRKAAHETV